MPEDHLKAAGRLGALWRSLWSLDPPAALGDFTTSLRVIPVSVAAVGIGVLSAFVALGLLRLIGLFTNLFFFGRLNPTLITPAGHHLGPLVILVPVAGAFCIGLMARYGSERIRGHGIPEALEAILIRGSRVEPRVAFLKPLSAAISIGSGGPFGAEGPIIMTGGAFGSMVAQFFHLTSAERKTLLVAGAAGGMSATFATPLAAALLAVELLLFEWKPRSFIPVALSSATAGVLRAYLLGRGPLFAVPAHAAFLGIAGLAACALLGLLAGLLSALLTGAVYAAEDAFHRLPVHWMWWPPIGGLAIGIGGYFFPQALGVGYDVIESLLRGEVPHHVIAGILLVKSLIWAIALGSGTSGGVLAPLLMMGGALGGLAAGFLPAAGAGFWPLIGMAAIMGGTMRAPFTAAIFALELTHDVNALLPLLVAVTVAHAFTVIVLRRSILTEKVSRRGFHLSREYALDPLEILFVREAMQTDVVALPADSPPGEIAALLPDGRPPQRLYPLVSPAGQLSGVVAPERLHQWMAAGARDAEPRRLADIAEPVSAVAYPDEPLRAVVYRMAETGITALPVVEPGDSRAIRGVITLADLLKARARNLEEERRRERVLRLWLPLSLRPRTQRGFGELVEERRCLPKP